MTTNYTAPQRKLLKEGELYGRYTLSPGKFEDQTPIDMLVNLVQAEFIDWDLSNPKFIELFHKTHPNASEEYLKEKGGMWSVLDYELNMEANQTEKLISMLIKRTNETKPQTSSGIMDVEIYDALDLSIRARNVVAWSAETHPDQSTGLGLNTIGKLVSTSKADIMKHRYIGRVTMKELTTKLYQFTFGKKHPHAPRATSTISPFDGSLLPAEAEKIEQWIDSDYQGQPPKMMPNSWQKTP